MSTQAQTLQELFILATGKAANALDLAAIESIIGPEGDLHQLDGIINDYMNAQEAQLGTIGIVRAVARHALGLELSPATANQAAADLKAAGLDTWAKIFHWLVNNDQPLANTLNARAEAVLHFQGQLLENGTSEFFKGKSLTAAVANLIQAIDGSEQSIANGRANLEDLANRLGPDGISGAVIDGYVKGATVFADANNNGTLDFEDGENRGARLDPQRRHRQHRGGDRRRQLRVYVR